MALTVRQLADFYERGYVVVENFLTSEEVESVKRSIAAIVDGGPCPEGVELGWEHDHDEHARKPQQILNVELASETVEELLQSERALTMATQLLGPEVGLHHAKVTLKSPKHGQYVPWHQDLAYWQHLSEHPVQVNCLIYLDDVDHDNGCLHVVPGSHRQTLWKHERNREKSTFVWHIPPEAVPLEAVEEVEARAGTAVLFGPLLVHSSGENHTSRDRRLLALEYTIPGMDRWCRRVVSEGQELPDPAAFYPRPEVAEVTGPGPYAGQCPEDYRRRELWKLSASLATDPARLWLDVSGGDSDTAAFEWLAARRPGELVRLERFPRATASPMSATILTGALEHSLESSAFRSRIEGTIGLAHFDSDLYVCVAPVLKALASHIGEGTVLIFDRFTSPEGELTQAAHAFYELAREHRLEVAYLARTRRQVVARITGAGETASFRAVEPDFRPTSRDLYLEKNREPREEEPVDSSRKQSTSIPRKILRRGSSLVKRAVEAASPSSQVMRRFFPMRAIPCVHGEGPRIHYCATHSRRKELWRYALSLVADASLPWCEFGVGEGESLDWLSLNKPPKTRIYGFDSFEGIPEPWAALPAGYFRSPPYESRRDDVEIVQGLFDESLSRKEVRERLQPQVGLVHIDCDLYSSTRTVLDALRELIGPGTIIVFDEFYNYPGWQDHESKAFLEFTREHAIAFEYVVRADYQVVVRIEGVGRFSHSIRPLTWRSGTPGIHLS